MFSTILPIGFTISAFLGATTTSLLTILARFFDSTAWPILLLITGMLLSLGTCSACIAPLVGDECSLTSVLWAILYHPAALIWALIWWKPIEWTICILIGYVFVSQIDNYLSWGIDLYMNQSYYLFFLILFTFKFFKITVHFFAYFLYRPLTRPKNQPAKYYPSRDVTVVIPTVGGMEQDEEFIDCVENLIKCKPKALIISTVGDDKLARARALIAEKRWGIAHGGIVTCLNGRVANKRKQLMAGIARSTTPIIVFADDHVYWPPTFLDSILIPFEDPLVGHVGTVKRVLRNKDKYKWHSTEDILNYIAALYLERHNYECTSSRAVDGGVFVISGRTACVRKSIFDDPAFQDAFTNEYWLGRGPMNVDDDNFITRWMITHGFKTVFHNTPEALMSTTLGEAGGYTKFFGQLKRWARTTVRSNTTTLLADRIVYRSQPWSVYAVYFSALVNFAVIFDPLLVLTWSAAGGIWWHMALLVLLTKSIKPLSVGYYWRNPADLRYLHVQIIFAYIHSFIKAWCLVTARDISWGTRAGVDDAVEVIDMSIGDQWDGAISRIQPTQTPIPTKYVSYALLGVDGAHDYLSPQASPELLSRTGLGISAFGKVGRDGRNGKNGEDGRGGVAGPPGQPGPPGPPGPSGPQGTPGINGLNGSPGSQGSPGARGLAGIGLAGAVEQAWQAGAPGAAGSSAVLLGNMISKCNSITKSGKVCSRAARNDNSGRCFQHR